MNPKTTPWKLTDTSGYPILSHSHEHASTQTPTHPLAYRATFTHTMSTPPQIHSYCASFCLTSEEWPNGTLPLNQSASAPLSLSFPLPSSSSYLNSSWIVCCQGFTLLYATQPGIISACMFDIYAWQSIPLTRESYQIILQYKQSVAYLMTLSVQKVA